jgi:hypothetical protein
MPTPVSPFSFSAVGGKRKWGGFDVGPFSTNITPLTGLREEGAGKRRPYGWEPMVAVIPRYYRNTIYIRYSLPPKALKKIPISSVFSSAEGESILLSLPPFWRVAQNNSI